jgi:hypothetical protein
MAGLLPRRYQRADRRPAAWVSGRARWVRAADVAAPAVPASRHAPRTDPLRPRPSARAGPALPPTSTGWPVGPPRRPRCLGHLRSPRAPAATAAPAHRTRGRPPRGARRTAPATTRADRPTGGRPRSRSRLPARPPRPRPPALRDPSRALRLCSVSRGTDVAAPAADPSLAPRPCSVSRPSSRAAGRPLPRTHPAPLAEHRRSRAGGMSARGPSVRAGDVEIPLQRLAGPPSRQPLRSQQLASGRQRVERLGRVRGGQHRGPPRSSSSSAIRSPWPRPGRRRTGK